MQDVWCHGCARQFSVSVSSWDGQCPECDEGFCEVLEQRPQARAQAPSRGASGGGPGHGGFQQTIRVPGGMMQVVATTGAPGDMFMGLGGPPGGEDALVQHLLESLMQSLGGPNFRMGGQFPDFMMGASEGENLDAIISQLMEQYEPRSQATSRRVRAALPRLRVRKAGSSGEAAEGEAVAAAGEACTVCHDAYDAGAEVVELPCSHCFHEDCISPWLDTHNSCPVCRYELPTEEDDGSPSRAGRQDGQPADSGGRRRGGASQQRRRQQEAPAVADGGGGGGSFAAMMQNIQDAWQRRNSGAGNANSAGGAGRTDDAEASYSRGAGSEGARNLRRRTAAGSQGDSTWYINDVPASPPARARGGGDAEEDNGEPPQEGPSGTQLLGMVLGGALGALTGSAIAAFFSGRRA